MSKDQVTGFIDYQRIYEMKKQFLDPTGFHYQRVLVIYRCRNEGRNWEEHQIHQVKEGTDLKAYAAWMNAYGIEEEKRAAVGHEGRRSVANIFTVTEELYAEHYW